MKIQKQNEPNSIIKYSVILEKKDEEQLKKNVMESISNKVKIPGFRKGHVTEAVVIQHMGEGYIQEEMMQQSVTYAYKRLLKKEKCQIISQPKANVVSDSPITLEFSIEVQPEISFKDYSKNGNAH